MATYITTSVAAEALPQLSGLLFCTKHWGLLLYHSLCFLLWFHSVCGRSGSHAHLQHNDLLCSCHKPLRAYHNQLRFQASCGILQNPDSQAFHVCRDDFDPERCDNQAALGLLQRFVSNGREADGSPTRERLKLIPRWG